jgi:O-antigen/teichoic acid export membrane protein
MTRKRSATRSRRRSAGSAPTTFLLAALARQIVEHIYGPKWEPGLPSFYLLCIPMINAAYSTVMVSALYSVGRAKVVLRLTLTWAAAGWALGVPLTLIIGEHGFALAMSVVSWLSIMSVREMNKVVKVRFVGAMVKVAVLSAIPAAIVGATARFVVRDAFSLAAMAAAGVLGYVALMLASGELDEPLAMIKRKLGRSGPAPEGAVEHA